MPTSDAEKRLFTTRGSVYLILALWTLLGAASIVQQLVHHENTSHELARIQAVESVEKDIVYRHWNAMHGGVYALVTEDTPSNPHLEFLEGRDLFTNDGKHLTLINPAYMTRQVHELGRSHYGLKGHITSLDPIRPENKADAWETGALRRFEQGAREYHEVVDYEGRPHLRYMRSLATRKACIKCHDNYEEGDIRGGISVAVPMQPFQELMSNQAQSVLLVYALIWATGLIATGWAYRQIRKRENLRNRFERALAVSEKRFRHLVEATSDWIWEVDGHLHFSYSSPAVHKILGYDASELIGRTPFELMDGKTVKSARAHFEGQGLSNNSNELAEITFVHIDGHEVICENSIMPKLDSQGALQGFRGVARDITKRRQAEAKLRKLALAVEQSPESIVITNLSPEIEYVNRAFIENSGYSYDEAIGQNPRILQSGQTDSATYDELWRSLTLGHPWKGEFSNRRKDGSEYTELAHISPLRQPDGEVTHYIAVKADITEKKRMGQELDRYRHHLEELIDERTVELRLARIRAEAANQAKSDFLANMSHEIRTPMNAIIGLTQLLQQSGLNSKQQEKLKKINTASWHLLSIINDILDLSKIETGKLHLQHEDFSLVELIEQITGLFKEQVRGKNLTMNVDIDVNESWLNGDPVRLKQALLNYVSNAVKFTEQGGIKLRVSEEDSDAARVLLRFEVEDSGIGIPKEQISRLFNAFEQLDNSRARRYGGTGLGLNITKRLAERMGGDCGVESSEGRGSVFWFSAWLGRGSPLPTADASDDSGSGDALKALTPETRILLVEDNELNREVASEMIGNLGGRVDCAENGIEALEKVAREQYHLILMDVQMPRMDGLEATRRMRNMEALQDTPILAMTANVFEEDKQACLDAGMNGFIRKPVELKNLGQSFQQWLPAERIQHDDSDSDAGSKVAPGRYSDDDIDRLMRDFIELLRTDDTTANSVYAESREAFAHTIGADALQKLDESMNDFNYPSALKIVDSAYTVDAQLESGPDSAEADAPPVVDLKVLTESFGDKPELHKRFLRKFRDQANDSLGEIGEALQRHDLAQVTFIAHKLKTSAKTVGALHLAEMFLGIERASDTDDIVNRIKALREEYSRVVKVIDEL